ncbi:hypothetical protein M758_1G046700 [Ceratodon purpureus]|nr:hypothetical protein M758_1G046700 [Ceratodon purpureus]
MNIEAHFDIVHPMSTKYSNLGFEAHISRSVVVKKVSQLRVKVQRCGRGGMDALVGEGLSLIPEEFRDPVQELEELRSFGEQKSVPDNAKPIVKKARRLLYRRLKVGVEDGRVFVGKFHCLDKQGNIILYDTVEFRNVPGSGDVGVAPVEQRGLGLVLIPARCRTSCHVECSLEEKMDFLNLAS